LLLRHARPSWSVVAGRNRVLERLRSVMGSRAGSRIEEAPATPFPQTGDRLWRVGRLPEMGSVTWRWKAPRVRLSASTFAGRRAKRPLPGAPAAAGPGTHDGAQALTCGVSRGRRAQPRLRRGRRFRTAFVTAHDMGCSSRSGRGKAPPASDRGGRGHAGAGIAVANHATPDRWKLGWPARESERGHPQPGTCSKGCDLREKSCTSGRPRVWCCGARTFVVVFVDRFDCRSRQAVPGIVRPCAKSARSPNAA